MLMFELIAENLTLTMKIRLIHEKGRTCVVINVLYESFTGSRTPEFGYYVWVG